MKRSPLKRKTPMARKPIRRGRRRSAYAARERDVPFMLWIRSLPCSAIALGGCEGVIEADHVGRRGMRRKCSDYECIPLCQFHHLCRGSWTGVFKHWDQEQMRAWIDLQLTIVAVVHKSVVSGRPDLLGAAETLRKYLPG